MIDGQFWPFQPIQFLDGLLDKPMGVGLSVPDITITDNGDTAMSGGGTATRTTIATVMSTEATGVIVITWETSVDAVTLTDLTWGGNAMSILEQEHTNLGATEVGAAIAVISGVQSGSVVGTFSGNVDGSATVTAISLTDVQSLTAVDTDKNTGNGVDISLTALTSPGSGGIRIVGFANVTQTSSAVTWTGATEISDVTPGSNMRHSAAYSLGDSSATITADSAENTQVIVGVSLR